MNFQQVLLDSSPIETILLFILVILSMVSWIMIFQRMFIISRAKRRTSDFEEYFWSGIDLTRFYKELKTQYQQGFRHTKCVYGRVSRV